MWYDNAVFYQIYPLGFCGAPKENDGITVDRISKLSGWIEHMKKLGINALYLSPVFQSDFHGYDTRDYYTVDCRLGTNEQFAQVCESLKENGIKIVLDGVFNHVGRGFWAFQDVLEKREASPYKDWFCINFGGNTCYNDGFWYEGWEGNFNLVKLNLKNPAVCEHIFSAIKMWYEQFKIDGIRLDVAYCLDKEFLQKLRSFCKSLNGEFLLLGELLHGDYNMWVNDQMLDSCTNYECYKGLYSSFNCLNMFEISYSLNRQFGREHWTLYKGKKLLSFADNHDVTRIADILTTPEHLPLVYAMLFTMPGLPCVYYGSEWAAKGKKEDSDYALRPCFDKPEFTELSELLSQLAKLKKEQAALIYGDYENIHVNNRQLVFCRSFNTEQIFTAINADTQSAQVNIRDGEYIDLLTSQKTNGSSLNLDGCSFKILKRI